MVSNRGLLGAESVTTAGSVNGGRSRQWVGRHRFVAFVALAYTISWGLWLVAANGGGQIPFLLGALGPMAAAAIVTAWTGESPLAWIRPVWRWRVPVRWWIYALGLPALLFAVVTLILQLSGSPVDWSLSVERWPSYLSTFVFVLFLGGGPEDRAGAGSGSRCCKSGIRRSRPPSFSVSSGACGTSPSTVHWGSSFR